MASPYPWHYDLRWPWLHLRPSLRAHVDLPRRPLVARFGSARVSRRVLMFGDLMGLTGDRVPTASRAVQELFARADLIVGNCEAPVVREHNDPGARYLMSLSLGSQYLRDFFTRFAADPTRCVLSVANNHAGDAGADGLRETEARLGALGVQIAGAKDGRPAPLIVREVGALRVGIAAWSTWMNAPLGGGANVPGPGEIAAIDWRERRRALALDTLLATPHWEWEFQHVPQPDTVAVARGLAAAGVDAIAGHHPHVIQPLAYFGDSTRPSLCAFSLGNLFARTVTWPHRLGALLELELAADDDADDRGRVIAYRLHPTVQTGGPDRARVVALAEAPSRLRARIEERLARLFDYSMYRS
jgi:poly-gamma-glutamate capsule biosynthesis protein CapA/YwtB (metallophosphatase superfamily)